MMKSESGRRVPKIMKNQALCGSFMFFIFSAILPDRYPPMMCPDANDMCYDNFCLFGWFMYGGVYFCCSFMWLVELFL